MPNGTRRVNAQNDGASAGDSEMLGEIAPIHREQAAVNRQQLKALCAQSEAGSLSPPPRLLSGTVLHNLVAEDDSQSFLEMFEVMALVFSWHATGGRQSGPCGCPLCRLVRPRLQPLVCQPPLGGASKL